MAKARNVQKAEKFDLSVFRSINNLVPQFKAIDPFMHFVARYGPVLFIFPLGLSYFLMKKQQHHEDQLNVYQALVGIGFVYLINTPLRWLVRRPRPYFSHRRVHRIDPVHHQPSFPSDHATVSFVMATTFRNTPPVLRIPTYLFAALISFTRVYSGEHYPSDVLGGSVIGIGVGLLMEKKWHFINEKIEKFGGILHRKLFPSQPE